MASINQGHLKKKHFFLDFPVTCANLNDNCRTVIFTQPLFIANNVDGTIVFGNTFIQPF